MELVGRTQRFIRIAVMLSAAAMSLAATAIARAAVISEDVKLVAKTAALAESAPAVRAFTVATAGPLVITLTDVNFPAALTSASLLVTRGTQVVERLTQVGTKQFNATPGLYSVQVLADSATAGTVGVTIAPPAGGTPLLAFQAGIVGTPTGAAAGQSSLAEKFTIATAGSYQLTAIDRAMPATLTSYELLVISSGGVTVARVCSPANLPTCGTAAVSFNAVAGEYDLFVNAIAADPAQAGLLSIQVTGPAAGPATIYGATHPIGSLKASAPIPVTADHYALSINDFEFPAALASKRAVVTQGGSLLLDTTTGGEFDATAGSIALYATATSGVGGVGSYGLNLSRGAQSVFSTVRAAIGDTQSGTRAFAFTTSIATAGQYRIQTNDFMFPAAIPSFQVVAAQKGAKLASATNGATVNVTAATGPMVVLVLANTLSSTSSGLFGLTVDSVPAATSPIFTATQGIGELFHTRTLSVAAAGGLSLTVSDLAFPAAFTELALAVTRGNVLVGQVFGSGALSFAVTPGDYSLNLIARTAGAGDYGTYGLKVEDAPQPIVALTSSVASVASGGTVNLSWTSTNATTCTASDGWSGSKPTTGAQANVGPLASSAKFTLTCTGPGGTANSSADVAVATSESKGGGGAFHWSALLALLAIAIAQRAFAQQRKSTHASA